MGIVLAMSSGAVASALGYVAWYHALPALTATRAATVQLQVPVLTALAGLAVLGEPLTVRLVIATVLVLGGIALAISARRAGN
jgi:drug/metabolite transporter (DMT)-like permease